MRQSKGSAENVDERLVPSGALAALQAMQLEAVSIDGGVGMHPVVCVGRTSSRLVAMVRVRVVELALPR